MSKKPWLKVDISELEKLHSQGYRDAELASHFRISLASVSILRRKLNLTQNKAWQVRINKYKFIKLFNDGMTMDAIAKELKIARSSVFKIRDKLDLPRRNKKQQIEDENGKGNTY